MSNSFTFPNNVIEIRNALDLEVDNAGRVTPVRLPRWTQSQMSDEGILNMARMGSGVRLRFRSSASELSINLRIMRIFVVGLHKELTPAPYELRINGNFNQLQHANKGNLLEIVLNDPDAGPGQIVDGESETLNFRNLPPELKDIEIWFPASTSSALESLSANAEILPPSPISKKKWVHYGSSISQCGETSSPSSIWAVNAAERLGLDIFNLGLAGQCQLDGFVARTIAEIPTDFISLKLGINILNADTMRERTFVPAVHNFAQLLSCGVRIFALHNPYQFEQAAIALASLARKGLWRVPTEEHRSKYMTSVILCPSSVGMAAQDAGHFIKPRQLHQRSVGNRAPGHGQIAACGIQLHLEAVQLSALAADVRPAPEAAQTGAAWRHFEVFRPDAVHER